MKAITVKQPWANLIAYGHKTIETRSWRVNHRGALAIHAGQAVDRYAPYAAPYDAEGDDLKPLPTVSLEPLGAIVAVARLAHVRVHQQSDEAQSLCAHRPHEARYAWVLEDVQRLPEPIAAIGRQGLWNLPFPVRRAVETELWGAPL